jgi:hypothetical protein
MLTGILYLRGGRIEALVPPRTFGNKCGGFALSGMIIVQVFTKTT